MLSALIQEALQRNPAVQSTSALLAAEAGAVQDIERARLRTIAAVRRAYTGLILARDVSALVEEQARLWVQMEESARSQYRVGLGTQHDVLRAQIQVSRLRESAIEQEADVVVRTAELNRLLGRAPGSEIRTEARLSLRPLSAPLADLLEEGQRMCPELKAAAARVEAGQAAITFLQQEPTPVAADMKRNVRAPMRPSVARPRGKEALAAAVAKATAETRAAEERRQTLALDLRLRTEERAARAQALEKIAELYVQGILPQGEVALAAALASYQTGKLPFATVLEALTRLHSDRAAYLRHVANHELVKAAIEEWSLDLPAEMSRDADRGGSASMSP